uniref:Polyprotein n=1 Tax=Cannabis sativa TaxID=3483 RepID=A0A803QEH7_CANSA
MCPYKTLFNSLEEKIGGNVLLEDNKAYLVKGIGTIIIKMCDNVQGTLTNVMCVPDLRRDLLSIGSLVTKECTIKINATYVETGANNNKMIDQTRLWHQRFGHVSERGLTKLERQGILKGKLSRKLDFCEECAIEKSCRVKFPSSVHTSKQHLDYIHSNLWGPSRVTTVGGASYFLSIIDDYSSTRAINRRNGTKLLLAIQEEMSTVIKNKTWIIVKRPPGQKLVDCKWIMKVKEAFLHGNLEEKIYMRQPEGFENGDLDKVCLLQKSLYGLKLAPRQWNIRFDEFMARIKFNKSSFDPCIYLNDKLFILFEFEIKDLGDAKKILSVEIIRNRLEKICLSHKYYLEKVLSKFNMSSAKPVTIPMVAHFKLSKDQSPQTKDERKVMDSVPYASAVGSLMYVKGTLDTGLAYYARSLTGYVFTARGRCISWKSNLQKVVTMSSIEAEYMEATKAIKEAIWVKGLTKELGFNSEYITVYYDNQSALNLIKNLMFHERLKYIDIKMPFIRDIIGRNKVQVSKVNTKDNPTDMFTKEVPIIKLRHCLRLLSIDTSS